MTALIVLDPGHGGTAAIGGSSPNNARGPTGLLEKTATLDVAGRARRRLLSAGFPTALTRSDDRNLGLAERAKVARAAHAPVFVSIHFNGFDGQAQGTETLLDVNHSPASRRLAEAVQAKMLAATGLPDRGVRIQPLGVLRPSVHSPATACCLVEISFMDVPREEARLKTEAYKDRLAQALADGVAVHLAGRGVGAASTSKAAVTEQLPQRRPRPEPARRDRAVDAVQTAGSNRASALLPIASGSPAPGALPPTPPRSAP